MSIVATPQIADPRSEAFADGFSAFLKLHARLDDLTLQRARRAHRQSGERFDLVLSRLGLLTEQALVEALAAYLDIPLAQRGDLSIAEPLHEMFPMDFMRTRRCLPLGRNGDGGVLVVTADPFAGDAHAAIGHILSSRVKVLLTASAEIDRLLAAIDPQFARMAAGPAPDAEGTASDADVRRLKDLASEAPIVRLVHATITRAVEMRASDIHVEPSDDGVCIRFRIDGHLRDDEHLPPAMSAAVVSRIKIMASLDIAERRLPQDGRIKTNVRGNEIDIRVSTVATLKGESIVLRILDRSAIPLSLASLGFDLPRRTSLEKLLREPNGILLVTGPTGSGKTTTLYAALGAINEPSRKIFTVEDPVEYQIDRINQMQIRPRLGLDFAAALRSILRQDPDIIMVGEIRDLETAQMTIESALTGHLVLSTVHTNSAAATITRLLQMGVADYLLASTLKGVLAQRLVRCLCRLCAVPDFAGAALVRALAERHGVDLSSGIDVRRAHGCASCAGTGFTGRTTISELMIVTGRISGLLLSKSAERSFEETAASEGMTTMFQDGLRKAADGVTTLEEVLRVARAPS